MADVAHRLAGYVPAVTMAPTSDDDVGRPLLGSAGQAVRGTEGGLICLGLSPPQRVVSKALVETLLGPLGNPPHWLDVDGEALSPLWAA